MNTFGALFRLTTFGESHGPALGAVIDGCPAGVPLTVEEIQRALDRRRPGQSPLVSARREADQVELLSGVYQGKTLGTPIAALVRNHDARPADYEAVLQKPRAGHADQVWRQRFGHVDHRGGGRTSGRETVSRVIGGAVARAFLAQQRPELSVVGWVSSVGELCAPTTEATPSMAQVDAHPTRCPHPETAERMAEAIAAAKRAGDSLGGTVELRVSGLPVGLGEPVFYKLKSALAAALASVGTVCGVELGPPGLRAAIARPGSEFHQSSAHYGGVQGGLSNGEPLVATVWLKPVSTLGDVAKAGRHDPCILPRVVPVLEAMTLLTLADLWQHQAARPHQP